MPVPMPAVKPPAPSAKHAYALPNIPAQSQRVRDLVTAILTQQKAINNMENGTLEFHLGSPGKDRDVKMKLQAFVTFAT